jgi:hypothetical protein
VPTQQSKQHINTPKADEEVIARSGENVELPLSKTAETRNENSDIVDLCIQEYIALRAEQRTRLDSANRIIHYYAIVLAALTVGILSLMKDNRSLFDLLFPNILLLIPLVSLPFAFAQQNEELFVRDIGDYFETIKEQITGKKDGRYWCWENHHNLTVSTSLIWKITGIFRSGLLIIFSALSLAFFYAIAYPRLVSPALWIHEFSCDLLPKNSTNLK